MRVDQVLGMMQRGIIYLTVEASCFSHIFNMAELIDIVIPAGVVAISGAERSRLVNGTAATRGDPQVYMVELEMFHQLHCLVRISYLTSTMWTDASKKWLRDQLWMLEDVVAKSRPLSNISQRMYHNGRALLRMLEKRDADRGLDHCIDYLRQAIMCHGDVTPITFKFNAEIDGYLAQHTTEHQCRNFDAIFKWAKSRDRTGMAPAGAHQNVELKMPEDYD